MTHLHLVHDADAALEAEGGCWCVPETWTSTSGTVAVRMVCDHHGKGGWAYGSVKEFQAIADQARALCPCPGH